MKITLSIPNVGPLGATYQFEEELQEESAQIIREGMLQQLKALCSLPRQLAQSPQDDSEFVPPTEKQLYALSCATQNARTTLAAVCAEHGFNPTHFSKREAQIMTTALNDKTGFSKIQEERKNNPGHFSNKRNLPDDSDIFE